MAGRKRQLTDKQTAFIMAYVVCWNATEAAQAAGYNGDRKTLAQIGYENLKRPHVRAVIDAITQENAMTAGEALGILADIARGNPGDFYSVDSESGKEVPDLEKARELGKLALVKSVTHRADGSVATLALYDRIKALEIILKALGVFTDGVTVQIDNVDLETWRKQAEQRLKDVLAIPDPYQGAGDGP